jgi:hypothetical protein
VKAHGMGGIPYPFLKMTLRVFISSYKQRRLITLGLDKIFSQLEKL